MEFRLQKVCTSIRLFKVLLFSVFFFPLLSHATLTITPQNIDTALASTSYYFATSNLTDGFIDTDAGFATYDLTLTKASYPTGMLILEIKSSNTSFSGSVGGDVYLSVYARATDDSYHPIPIIAASNITAGIPALCAPGGLCGALNGAYYYSALYTIGSTLTIGIYPYEMCAGMNSFPTGVGKYPSGCTSAAAVTTPTDGDTSKPSGSVTQFTLDFVIGVADATYTQIPDRGDSENDDSAISVSFQNKAADVSCSTSPSVYFPGDQEIIVFPPLVTATLSSSGSAPIDEVIAVGNEASFANSGSTTANQIFGRISASLVEGTVSGFQNVESTAGGIDYNVAFTIRDKAGIITNYPTSNASNCAYEQVKTSSIEGFLNESKCFIATGAFGAEDNSALELLRNFRDEVLFKTDLGSEFVFWYYSWSPDAAHYLLNHQWARYPVMTALIPLQVLAWLFLNPLVLIVLASLGIVVLLFARKRVIL